MRGLPGELPGLWVEGGCPQEVEEEAENTGPQPSQHDRVYWPINKAFKGSSTNELDLCCFKTIQAWPLDNFWAGQALPSVSYKNQEQEA